MNKKFPLIILVFIILISGFAIGSYAQTSVTPTASAFGVKEVKSLQITFNFTKSLPANTNVTFSLPINSTNFPDGIDHFINANLRIFFDKAVAISQDFRATINGTACSNSPYTTAIGSGQYVVDFQCLNAITQVFNTTYNVTFSTDRTSQNVVFSIFTTYINNPDFSNFTSQTAEQLGLLNLIFSKVYEDGNILRNDDFCIDDSTSRKQLTTSSNSTVTQRNIDTFCQDGCDNETGKCRIKGFQADLLFIIIIFAIIGVFLRVQKVI